MILCVHHRPTHCLPTRWTHEQIERDDVRDHLHGHVDDQERVHGAKFACDRRKVDLDRVVTVEDAVGQRGFAATF
jgi:hypothetical protein